MPARFAKHSPAIAAGRDRRSLARRTQTIRLGLQESCAVLFCLALHTRGRHPVRMSKAAPCDRAPAATLESETRNWDSRTPAELESFHHARIPCVTGDCFFCP